jgi:repressor LexA
VLVQRTPEARNGDIVVAVLNGVEGTLKRFYHEPHGMIRLQPANSSMEPRLVRASEVEVKGKLVAVLRKY